LILEGDAPGSVFFELALHLPVLLLRRENRACRQVSRQFPT
jgi:hypothetical protein